MIVESGSTRMRSPDAKVPVADRELYDTPIPFYKERS